MSYRREWRVEVRGRRVRTFKEAWDAQEAARAMAAGEGTVAMVRNRRTGETWGIADLFFPETVTYGWEGDVRQGVPEAAAG